MTSRAAVTVVVVALVTLGIGTARAQTPSPQPNATAAPPSPSNTATPTAALSPSPQPSPLPVTRTAPRSTSVTRIARGQAQPTVSATDDVFSPATIEIDPGETVTWNNDGETVHTVTADDASFDSGPMAAGDSFSFAFAAPGTYAYHCAVHGAAGGIGMAGTVVVRGAVADPPDGGTNEGVPGPAATAAPAASEVLPATGASPFAWLMLALAHISSGTLLLRLAREE